MIENDPTATDTEKAAWRSQLLGFVDEAYPEMVAIREHLHANPEPSGEELQTTEFVKSQFDPDRFTTENGPDGRGLVVEPRDNPEGPRLAIRADMDALRIQDAKSVPYRSKRTGIMHACGHDAHTATVLGVARSLDNAAQADSLPWPVPWRAIFQPAEETNRGAIEMVRAGALDNVAAIIGAHVDPKRPIGTIGLRAGAFTADCVEIGIRVIGKGGHASRPHESQDPIATAAQLISSIYLFVPRATDSLDPVIVTIGQIHGGDTPNAIPEEVRMRGTLRTLNHAARIKTMDHLRKLCRGLAETSDTVIDIEFIEGPPAVINDDLLNELLRASASELLGAENVMEMPRPSMGGEDFANYLDHVPGAMFRLGCGPVEDHAPPLHSPHFDIVPEALAVGAKILTQTAVAWARPKD
jgi:amidohydrolase